MDVTAHLFLHKVFDIMSKSLCKKCAQSLLWRHNGRDSVSNHQPHYCLPNRLFRRRSKKTSKLRVTGLCAGKSPATGEFPAQKASNAENVFIWWRHHGYAPFLFYNTYGKIYAVDLYCVFHTSGTILLPVWIRSELHQNGRQRRHKRRQLIAKSSGN